MPQENTYQDEYQVRLKKLEKIRQANLEPYPAKAGVEESIAEILTNFEAWEQQGKVVHLGGRIRSLRWHGGACFIDLDDGDNKIQVYLKKDNFKDEEYQFFIDTLDLGDFIAASGTLMKTHRGENTVLVTGCTILTKALLPLPEKWHGLADSEIRYRQRYLDILANPEVKEKFIARSKIIQFIRDYFLKQGFLEVDTPILQPLASGAIARPFVTKHLALKMDLFLRVAPEIYLKELIIGGFPKVFEIARCFRNEGIDYSHNPEFSQIEFYWAFKDYTFLMDFMEDFLIALVESLTPASPAKRGEHSTGIDFQGQHIEFAKPFLRLDFRQALIDYADIDLDEYNAAELGKVAKKKGLAVEKFWGKGKLADELYKEFVRPKLIQPTYIINHPIELSPLAKKIPGRPNYVERFQLVLGGGLEMMNAFSELNDPLDQEERFAFQTELA
ncbi:MAG: lysine--tRNA ligase, partial [Candidatus Komeilibacteria bacterium]|nr:lysine--tRNA ligase [Candidatus Komeilibacteria bacterium]